eukprot:7197067-Pyramimonas_sp.AAC.1
MTPEVVADSAVPGWLKSNIIFTKNGTCTSTGGVRTLDFFILSAGLSRCLQSVETVLGTDIKTHTP